MIWRLDKAGIAYARMNSMTEFLTHPQLESRGRWHQVGTPAGPIRALAPPVSINNEDPRMGPIPALGAHTDAILRELGYDEAATAALRAEGTI